MGSGPFGSRSESLSVKVTGKYDKTNTLPVYPNLSDELRQATGGSRRLRSPRIPDLEPDRLRPTAIATANENTGNLRSVQTFARHSKPRPRRDTPGRRRNGYARSLAHSTIWARRTRKILLPLVGEGVAYVSGLKGRPRASRARTTTSRNRTKVTADQEECLRGIINSSISFRYFSASCGPNAAQTGRIHLLSGPGWIYAAVLRAMTRCRAAS